MVYILKNFCFFVSLGDIFSFLVRNLLILKETACQIETLTSKLSSYWLLIPINQLQYLEKLKRRTKRMIINLF